MRLANWRWWLPGREPPYRFDELAKYNSEKWRGIVHTPEYDERMRREQELFDSEQQEPE